MINKAFWHKSNVLLMGGGSWGTVLAQLMAPHCQKVFLWVRSEERAKSIQETRENTQYMPGLTLHEHIEVISDLDGVFTHSIHSVFFVLPSAATREWARVLAPKMQGDEVIIHATKGVEQKSLKRISTVLLEELPCRRIGVLSGPNLAAEIAKGEPAATVVASPFVEVIDAGKALLGSSDFRVHGAKDVVGVEWAGVLKNILAIAAGCLDALEMGWNVRAMLISRGLEEMVRFGVAMGAEESTFLGLAGIGDLMATCSSPLSRNYQVGFGLGKGKSLNQVLEELGSTAEGVKTSQNVFEFAQEREIQMPITEGVYRVLTQAVSPKDALDYLIGQPQES